MSDTSFQDRHGEIMKKVQESPKPPTPARLWRNTATFGAVLFIPCYFWLAEELGRQGLFIANKAIASTAFLLIGLSFALSGIAYFWNFADKQIVYRKYLGLLGFMLAGLHVLLVLFWVPDFVAIPGWLEDNPLSATAGLFALMILTGMAAISNKYATVELGSKAWRRLLRVGYLAYVLIIVHFLVAKYDEWIAWFDEPMTLLPPMSFVEFLLGLGVFVLRTALWAHQLNKVTTPERS